MKVPTTKAAFRLAADAGLTAVATSGVIFAAILTHAAMTLPRSFAPAVPMLLTWLAAGAIVLLKTSKSLHTPHNTRDILYGTDRSPQRAFYETVDRSTLASVGIPIVTTAAAYVTKSPTALIAGVAAWAFAEAVIIKHGVSAIKRSEDWLDHLFDKNPNNNLIRKYDALRND